MELNRYRRTTAISLFVAVAANLVYSALVPIGDTAAERLDQAASRPGLTGLAVVMELTFRVGLCVGVLALLPLVRERVQMACVGAALVVSGSLCAVLADAPFLVYAEAPADEAGRSQVVDAVDGLTGAPAYLALVIGGLLVLTAGTTVLLLALRPAGWAPLWVLVAFLVGGVVGLVGANFRPAVLVGALLVGAALAYIGAQVVRSGHVTVPAVPQAVVS